MAKKSKVWYVDGNTYELSEDSVKIEELPNGVYVLGKGMFGFYLRRVEDKFNFDYKIYGLEEKVIDRVINSYTRKGTGNLGVLLNGTKGTGKSVTAKIIANKLNQPIILVTQTAKELEGGHHFLNSIPQNITIFLDEYEKMFGQSSEMLTIMDGALNSRYRRVFLLTTNDLHVDKNLLERPSRVRYLKKFGNLTTKLVEEIVDDLLENKELKQSCLRFIASLEIITVDIVKSVIEEVNIHNEDPHNFADIFNVSRITGKYDIDVEDGDGVFTSLLRNAKLNYRPSYTENHIGQNFYINDEWVGTIGDVYSYNTIRIEPVPLEDFDDNYEDLDEAKKKTYKDKRIIKEPIVIKMLEAEMTNYTYSFGYGSPERKRTPLGTSNKSLSSIGSALSGKRAVDYVEEDD